METTSTETLSPPASTTTIIAEYSVTEASLAELRERIGKTAYDVATTAGMDLARKDRRELVSLRTSLEAKRKEIKAPALAHCNLIDAEAKRITAELLKLEQPIDALIKEEEARKEAIKAEKERIERQRVEGIRTRIDKIKGLPLMAVNFTSAELTEFIGQVDAQPVGVEFEEFTEEATTAKAEVITALNNLLAAKQRAEEEAARIKAEQEAEATRLKEERERLEAERIEREKNEAEERERIRLEQEQEATRLAAEKAENNRIIAEQTEALRVEREAFEREQATIRQQQEEAVAEQRRKEAAAEVSEVAVQETVTILKSEYEQLLADSKLLNALRGVGVDNWDGYNFAMETLEAA